MRNRLVGAFAATAIAAAALVDGRAVDGGRAAYGTGRGRGHRGVRVNAHPYLFHAHVQRKMN